MIVKDYEPKGTIDSEEIKGKDINAKKDEKKHQKTPPKKEGTRSNYELLNKHTVKTDD